MLKLISVNKFFINVRKSIGGSVKISTQSYLERVGVEKNKENDMVDETEKDGGKERKRKFEKILNNSYPNTNVSIHN